MNIYEEARRRTAELEEMKAAKEKAVTERSRDLARKRVSKYARTEKGRQSNARRCRKYREKNRSRLNDYNREWHEAFEKEHGMKYGKFRYRLKHGLVKEEKKCL